MITKDDTIVTVYAETAIGPGWMNRPIWVIVRGKDGVLREECIQPEERNDELHTLALVSEAINDAMVAAVNKLRRKK